MKKDHKVELERVEEDKKKIIKGLNDQIEKMIVSNKEQKDLFAENERLLVSTLFKQFQEYYQRKDLVPGQKGSYLHSKTKSVWPNQGASRKTGY